mmetsp:Transcript_87242/g.251621  ORF Transcript_87242/g.251621 Transcript_87242/m.251621 type:complete len:192 (+) Transcript_87242:153-728(+)
MDPHIRLLHTPLQARLNGQHSQLPADIDDGIFYPVSSDHSDACYEGDAGGKLPDDPFWPAQVFDCADITAPPMTEHVVRGGGRAGRGRFGGRGLGRGGHEIGKLPVLPETGVYAEDPPTMTNLQLAAYLVEPFQQGRVRTIEELWHVLVCLQQAQAELHSLKQRCLDQVAAHPTSDQVERDPRDEDVWSEE